MIIDFRADYLFISTGDKTGFYTLHQGGIACHLVDKEEFWLRHSYYIKNLSTDKAKAETRAAECSRVMGLPLNGGAKFDLKEIKRQSEEIAAEQREQAERKQREYEAKREIEYKEQVSQGSILLGKYIGLSVAKVAEIDPDYLRWMAGQYDSEDEPSKFKASAYLAYQWVQDNPEPIRNWVGEVGDKIEIQARMTKCTEFDTMYGTNFLFRFVDDSGNVYITFSQAKSLLDLEIGDIATVKATVKAHQHSDYETPDNNKVTVLNRPKAVRVEQPEVA